MDVYVDVDVDVAMDAGLDVAGAHRGAKYIDHQIEGDDDKVAWVSKVCMVNSEVCHGMELSDFALRIEKAVYKQTCGCIPEMA